MVDIELRLDTDKISGEAYLQLMELGSRVNSAQEDGDQLAMIEYTRQMAKLINPAVDKDLLTDVPGRLLMPTLEKVMNALAGNSDEGNSESD